MNLPISKNFAVLILKCLHVYFTKEKSLQKVQTNKADIDQNVPLVAVWSWSALFARVLVLQKTETKKQNLTRNCIFDSLPRTL